MGSLKSDEYIRWAARELHVDQWLLRDLLNTADADELLQRAARMVVDHGKSVEEVARVFGVNEEHLGRAVWFMKENRQQDGRSRLQELASTRSEFDQDLKTAAVRRVWATGNSAPVARDLDIEEWIVRSWLHEGWAIRLRSSEMTATRRRLDDSYKEAAVRQVLSSGGRGASWVAEELGIDEEMLKRWCNSLGKRLVRQEQERRRHEERRRFEEQQVRARERPWEEDPS